MRVFLKCELIKLLEEKAYSANITDIHLSGPAVKNHQHGKLCTDRCPKIINGHFQFDCSSSSPDTTRRRSSSSSPLGSHEIPQKLQNKNKNNEPRTCIGRLFVARFARVVGRVHRKSTRRRSVSIKGHTRKHFSFFRFGTSCKSGTKEAQYFYSLPYKIEIAKSASEPRLHGLLARNAVVMQYFVQKTLVS